MRSLVLLLLLGVASSAFAQASMPEWRLVDLGTLGGSYSCPNAINNKGDIVGQSSLKDSKFEHAVLWTKDQAIDLGTIDGFASSCAIGISDAGFVVGEAWVPFTAEPKKRALTWNAHKAAQLGALRADTPAGAAYDVNDAGLAVGRAWVNDAGTKSGARASLLEGGKATLVPACDLPDHAGTFTPEVATAVNKGGTVVGAGRALIAGTPLRRGFVYRNGVTSDPLWAFDAKSPSWVTDLNDAGDLVMQRLVGDPAKNVMQPLIVRGDKVTEIAPLEGYQSAELRAINAKGDAVGYAWNPTDGVEPMVVVQGRSIDPNKALAGASEWKIVLLTDLNDAGQIVGIARKGESTHAVRLDPVGGNGMKLASAEAPVAWTTAFAGPRPNPATSAAGAQFAFTLAQRGDVTIALTNVQGRRVRTLTGTFDAGPSTLLWDGRDDRGARVGSGVFFARFVGLGTAATRKVVMAD